MSKKKKVIPDFKTFMNEAEKIMRRYADQNKYLITWRGKSDNEHEHLGIQEDTIIVGMGSEEERERGIPGIPIMKVWCGSAIHIDFDRGSDEGYGLYTHLSCKPLEEVERLAKKLPDFLS